MLSMLSFAPRFGGGRSNGCSVAVKQVSVLALRSLSSTPGTNYDVVVIGKTTMYAMFICNFNAFDLLKFLF